jgi:hypothetical protein
VSGAETVVGGDVEQVPLPDPETASRMADAAEERGDLPELVEYLRSVAAFLTKTRGCAIVPVNPGDEVLLRRTYHMGTAS